MTSVLLIIQALGAVTSMIAPTLAIALRWKRLLELDPDVSVNVADLTGKAIQVNQETADLVDSWFAEKGL